MSEKGKIIGAYTCQNPECDDVCATITVREGQLMTANVKVHCGMPMKWRQTTPTDQMFFDQVAQKAQETTTKQEEQTIPNTFTVEDWKAIGTRLKEAREQCNVTISTAASLMGEPYTPQHVMHWEQGVPVPPDVLLSLITLYNIPIHHLLQDPKPYKTPGAWIEAYLREEISEDELAEGLGLGDDIVMARYRAQRYQKLQAGIDAFIAQEAGEHD